MTYILKINHYFTVVAKYCPTQFWDFAHDRGKKPASKWLQKYMMKNPRNILGVIITLLYIQTMLVNISVVAPAWHHLMAKSCCLKNCLIIGLGSELGVDVKVCCSFVHMSCECSSTCYTPIQYQTTTIAAPTCCHTPTWWPNIAWEPAGNRGFFLIWGRKSTNMVL